MTLIEVLIVMALIALILSAVVIGSGQLGSSRARHASTMIAGAIRIGYTRATATSKTVRLVMDFDEKAIWLEEGDQPHLVQEKDVSGSGGAAAATVAEKAAQEESGRILKGPTAPKTAFSEIDPMGLAASTPGKGHKALDTGVLFKEVQTGHDDTGRKDGRAYLYFWPGGQTERASIQLKTSAAEDAPATLSILVAPLTGRVQIKDGAVDMPKPVDDKESSDREDPGAF
jgi:general secretion pathway protein H